MRNMNITYIASSLHFNRRCAQRTRAQTAAYLLGIRPELPSIIDTTEQTSQELDKSKL
jgi:hypothetical protein